MSIELEARALEAIQVLVKQAEACRNLCDEAGMDYPAPLLRILGLGAMSAGPMRAGQLRIGPPAIQSRPPGAAGDWVAVPVTAMSVQTGIVAVLRRDGSIQAKSVIAEFESLGVSASAGSVANAGTRLESRGVIHRGKNGWSLVDPTKAPILKGKYLWGPSELFTTQEIAARRREAIYYLLERFADGLQNLQILNRLKDLDWLRAPLSKDLVKIDMEEMQRDGLVRRVGNSKKWALSERAS